MQHSTSKKLKNVLSYVTLIVAGLYLVIWALSPVVVRHFVEPVLDQHNIVLGPESNIRYNPFLTQVTINGLKLKQGGETPVRVKSLKLQVHLFRLLANQIYVSKFEMDGLSVDIVEESSTEPAPNTPPNHFRIGGFLIESSKEVGVDESTRSQVQHPEQASEFPYQIIVDEVNISNLIVTANVAGGQHELSVKSLNMTELRADDKQQKVTMDIDAYINEARATVLISAILQDGIGDIIMKGAVEQYDLSTVNPLLVDTGVTIQGSATIDFENTVKIEQKDIRVQSTNILITGEDIELESDAVKLVSKKQVININSLQIEKAEKQKANLDLVLDVNIDETKLLSAQSQDTLSAWDTLQLNDIKMNVEEDVKGSLSTLIVSGLTVSEKFPDKLVDPIPALVKLGEIRIDKVVASKEKAEITRIQLSGLGADFLIGENKDFLTLVDFSFLSAQSPRDDTPSKNTTEHVKAPIESSEKPKMNAFELAVQEIVLVDTDRIFFQDASVNPSYERTFFIDRFETGPFSTAKPHEKSPFVLDGRSDKYAKFNFNGNVSPLTDLLNFELQGHLKEVSLPSVSTYLKDALGFELKSGQLDSDIEVSVNESIISGKTKLNIRGIEMSASDDNEANSLHDNKAVPLNVALSMLKDRKNNIELKIPLSGNINEPSFGVSHFIALVVEKAAMQQAKTYLLQTFVPYANVVTVVMAAGEHALKVRFNDLIYKDNIVDINEEQKVFVRQFIELLEDKPDTQVKVCSIASASDIPLTDITTPLNDSAKDQLQALAQQRANNFKNYVLAHSKIESSRLLLCSPEIDMSDKSQPRIEFST
mgnify:CR=1 FL=1